MLARRLVVLLSSLALLAAGCGEDKKNELGIPEAPEVDQSFTPGIGEKPPLELPSPGHYEYDLAGTSSLGPLPATASLKVETLPAAEQRWTLDHPERQGQASIESLVVKASFDGIRLASHRIEQPTPAGPLVLEFEPSTPVLMIPFFRKPGNWTFDLSSKDGCYESRSEIIVHGPGTQVPVRDTTYTSYHVEITSTYSRAKPVAPCQNLNLRRVQKLWLDSASHLPVRDESHFERRTPGPAVTSDVTASIRSTTPA